MPTQAEFQAREMCRQAGYDPDQLVVEINAEHDFDFLCIGLAPVTINNIQPVFMKFLNAPRLATHPKSPRKRSTASTPS